jgi:signal transduction histidine kinase/ligand-binding sensor domain-containing protein
MREFLKIVLLLSVLYAIPQAAGSQEKPRLNVIGRITPSDGMLAGGIKYAMKDSDGFMWFAYSSGFNRWDGHGVFNLEDYLTDTNVISSYRYCRPILEDTRGYLYVGTLRNGLVRIDRATNEFVYFINDPGDPHSLRGNGIHDMILDDDGTIWLGTFVYGLSHFDPVKETFRNYIVDETVSYPYDCNNIRSLHKDSRKTLWVGTSVGLYQFDEETETFIPVKIPVRIPAYLQSYESMVEDANGDIWFGTNGGILRYYGATGKWEYIDTGNTDKPGSADDMSIVCMVEFHKKGKHQLWIGTSAGLKVYDIKNGTLTHCTPKNGYPAITNAGAVQYLFIDEQDILWAGLGGVTLFDLNDNPFQIRHICSYPDSLYDTRATCFYEDRYGYIWVGTERDGLFKYDDALNLLSNYKPCAGNFEMAGQRCLNEIKEIYEDREGRLWVHTGPTGLSLFDMETGTFHFVEADVGSYLPGEIVQDSFGIHWIGAYDGLFKCRMSGDKALRLELYDNPTLPRVPVDELLSDTRGRLWLITRASGVYCLPPENRGSMTFKRYLHKDYRYRFTIEYNARTMIEDDRGNIWFRSERGLYRYDPALDSIVPDEYFNKKYKGYNFSFTRDKNGIFWLGWEKGLLCYNPADTGQSAIRVMDYRNGLPYSFITRSTMFTDSRGYLYGGGQETTRRGFFRFHPDSIPPPNKFIPNIFITRFQVRNMPFPMDSNIAYARKIILRHDQNFFAFEFSALNYIDPVKNQYAYMLEGLDDDWVYTGNRRFANYTGVPPGHYIFRVKGSNNDGYWNEAGASIAITILKPPWRSWWAGTIYGLVIAGMLISIFWYYLKRQQLKSRLALEHFQKEKLEEMDRMKSRFFANISHEFRTPLTLILGPIEKLKAGTQDPETTDDLEIMHRNARRLQRLIDQLLGLSKIEAGQMKLHAREENLVPFVKGYLQSFDSAARQKGIELIFEADEENIPVFIDRDKMEKVLFNLLSNAIKFTPERGRIVVTVGGQRSAVISITDTGPGISPAHLPHIFDRFYQADDSDARFQEGTGIGLALAKELVELHHGEIRVESELGKGTAFFVLLPLGSGQLREEEKRGRGKRGKRGRGEEGKRGRGKRRRGEGGKRGRGEGGRGA